MPERAQHAALGLEGHVDGLERDAGLGGDRRHRRRRVALPLEQPLRRLEDLAPGRGRLLAPARASRSGVVLTGSAISIS